jgi:hypothetical protein
MAFDHLHSSIGVVPAGIVSGALAQTLTTPFFIKSLKGQMGSKSSTVQFTYKPTAALIARGGLLGFCHLSVMHTVLGFLE